MKLQLPTVLLLMAFGYVCGSFPTGVIISRARGINIFERGSKNPGATNILRVLGPAYAATVLVVDVLKGAIPALVGSRYYGSLGVLIAGIPAIAGHNWSLFLGFKGGKGVATTAGVFVVAFPRLFAVGLVVFLTTIALTRYVSLGSLLGSWAAFGYSLWITRQTGDWLPPLSVLIAAVTITFRHKSNMARLLAGTERKLGEREEGVSR